MEHKHNVVYQIHKYYTNLILKLIMIYIIIIYSFQRYRNQNRHSSSNQGSCTNRETEQKRKIPQILGYRYRDNRPKHVPFDS